MLRYSPSYRRRSAMISLSDLDDQAMRDAKSGNWWRDAPHRALANNSAVYTGKPDTGTFLKEWTALYESRSGERGIFNRTAALHQAVRNGRRQPCDEFGVNPCCEIILRPFEFCNLTEAVVRSTDSLSTLKDKITLATILGTLQATCTNFKYLRQRWKNNCDEERLLGVSMTGIYDNSNVVLNPFNLEKLRDTAVEVNKSWAEQLGINQSAAVTCVKPSGTVSELVDSASGIHPRWAPYYIRTVRADNKDPLTQFMKDQGIPNEPAFGKEESTTIFSFPKKSPEDSLSNSNISSTEHFFTYLGIQQSYCEHKPSVTINVKEDEWVKMAYLVYDNFHEMVGVSFLPALDHVYKQAPFQTCTEEEYLAAVAKMPSKIDWSELALCEAGIDTTTSSQELACTGGVCSVVDIE